MMRARRSRRGLGLYNVVGPVLSEALEARKLLASLVDLVGLDAVPVEFSVAADAIADQPGEGVAGVIAASDARHDLLWLANHVDIDTLGTLEKVDASLLSLTTQSLRDGADFSQMRVNGSRFVDGFLSRDAGPLVSITTLDSAALSEKLGKAGYEVIGQFQGAGYGLVDVIAPTHKLIDLAGVEGVHVMRATPLPKVHQAGNTRNQWEDVTNLPQLNRVIPGSDGTNIDYGVMSDSINQVGQFVQFFPLPVFQTGIAASQFSNDLPASSRITVLDDYTIAEAGATGPQPSDEGRAMAELMHDIAPAADILYHTAFQGEADFASGILELAAAGADVIVDDIRYLSTPAFQDGVIAQAANTVASTLNVPYFSSAGNQNGQTFFGNWSTFDDGDNFLNFSAGDELLGFTIAPNARLTLGLHWSQPQGASRTDFDLLIQDGTSNTIIASDTSNNLNGNPFASIVYTNTTAASQNLRIRVDFKSGLTAADTAAGTDIFLITFGGVNFTDDEWGGPSSYGQPNSAFGFGVAAADVANQSLVPEAFSSLGGIPIRFNANGTPIAGSGTIRQQPAFMAGDGTATSVQGFSNFFGTSAAAPNAAAVAVLMQEAAGGPRSLTFAQTNNILRQTATDTGASGYDFTTGSGKVEALPAVVAAASLGRGERYFEIPNNGFFSDTQNASGNSDLESWELAFDRSGATGSFDVTPDFNAGIIRIAGDPDAAGGSNVRSHFNVNAGTTVTVTFAAAESERVSFIVYPRVDISGFSSSQRDIAVSMQQSPTPLLTIPSSQGLGQSVVDSTISSDYDSDWYAFTTPSTLPAGNNVFVGLSRNTGLDAVIGVYRTDGTLVARADSLGAGGAETLTLQLDPGTPYRVRVGSFLGRSNGDYRLVWQPELDQVDEFPTRASEILVFAPAIPFGPTSASPNVQGQRATFTGSDSEFIGFSFKPLPGVGNTITVDTNGSTFDTVLGIYALDGAFGTLGRLIAVDDDGGNGTQSQITFTAEPNERYMALISPFTTTTGLVNYSLNIDYGQDPGTIFSVSLDSSGSATRTFSNASNALFFSFVAPQFATGTGSVTLTDGASNGDLYIFDSNGTLLGGNSTGGSGDETVNLTGLVPGQTYHITVIPENFIGTITSGMLDINLGVDVPPPPPPAPVLFSVDDSGVFDDDGVTNINNDIDFPVNVAQGQFVRLFRDGVLVSGPVTASLGSLAFPRDRTGPLADGNYTYTYTLSNSMNGTQSAPSAPATITIDTVGPQRIGFELQFDEGPQDHFFFVDFDEALFGLTSADIIVNRITTAGTTRIDPADFRLVLNAAGDGLNDLIYDPTAGNDILPDGDLEVIIASGAATDRAGNPSDAFFGEDFFLNGDANRDRTVGFADLLILAQNYGLTGRTYSQGNLDYSPDGLVGFSDLLILAQNYNASLIRAEPTAPLFGRRTISARDTLEPDEAALLA